MPRWIHHVWARVFGWFWLPCPECSRPFGGHEVVRHGVSKYMPDGSHLLVCKHCAPVIRKRQIDEIERFLNRDN